ncbi:MULTISPECIES: LysR family transcriptional regulator [Xanthobacter]|uniref:LysR family transcriptional regulator n=1 Tax=Xanthobacter TaxID=279 RepID=UPI00145EB808|nr:LysR family transcriptional regulator [Xanthobacter sp. SG618]NMN57811.1 DNA-binding transcriptional LysR family regulator [Xanthobacter sp. SG618]
MEWDDLRFFLELARTRTLTEAARRLDVKHTTVARRIQRLELAVGAPVFTRTHAGHELTLRGRNLLVEAQAIEDLFLNMDQEETAPGPSVSGIVRVGCTEGYGVGVLPTDLAELRKQHPNLRVDLIVQPRPILLARNEADIVITIDRPERGPYLITKLYDYTLRLYASPSYLAAHKPIRRLSDLKDHHFVSYIEESGPAKGLPVIWNLVQSNNPGIRSTSIFSQMAIVASGGGIAILPSYLVGQDEAFSPVLGSEVSFQRTYWVMMPTELKRIARVQAVWQFLKRTTREHSQRLMV